MKNLTWIAFLLLLASCEDGFRKEIDFDEDEFPTQLVLSAFPGEDSIAVSLSLSQGILVNNPEFEPLDGATIKLYENSNLLEQVVGLKFSDKYEFTSEIQNGREYKIEASHPGYNSIEANTYVPAKVNDLTASGVISDNRAKVNVEFYDVPDAEFYRLIVLDGEYPISWSTSSEYFEIDPFDDETYYYENGFFEHLPFIDGRAEIEISVDFFYSFSELTVLIVSCSEDYFNYYKSRYAWEEANFSGPFAEPVQIYNNIENGIGIFAGYSIAETIVEF